MIILKGSSLLNLLLDPQDEVLIDKTFVLPLQSPELFLCNQAIGDEIELKLLHFTTIFEACDPLGLPLVHFVVLRTLDKALYLSDYVLSVVDDPHEGIFDTFLEVCMLDPLAKLPATHTDLLEILQGHFLEIARQIIVRCVFHNEIVISIGLMTASDPWVTLTLAVFLASLMM